MVLYETSFWTHFPRPVVIGLSAGLIMFLIPFTVFYSSLIKVLKVDPRFKDNVFYFILSNLAIADFLFVVSTVVSATMSLKQGRLFALQYEICSAIHALYEWSLHLFSLILAVKLVILILGLEMKHTSKVLRFLTLFISKSLFINLILNNSLSVQYTYIVEVITYSVDLQTASSRQLNNVWFYLNLLFIATTILCYSIVFVHLLLTKLRIVQRSSNNDSHGVFLCQGLATFLPVALYFAISAVLSRRIARASLAVSIVASLLPRFIPLCNFLGIMAFNRELRRAYITNWKTFLARFGRRGESSEEERTSVSRRTMGNSV